MLNINILQIMQSICKLIIYILKYVANICYPVASSGNVF